MPDTSMVVMSISTVRPGPRGTISKNSVMQKLLVVWMKSTSPYCSKDRTFMILTVRTVRRVHEQERRAFRNIQVRIILVGEVCLQSPHGGPLVSIADADELVRVASAPSGLPDYLAKLAELLSYLTEGADVQVEKICYTARTYHSQCPWVWPGTGTSTCRTAPTSQIMGSCSDSSSSSLLLPFS